MRMAARGRWSTSRACRDGGLRNVHGADNLVGDAVDLFFFVEGQVGSNPRLELFASISAASSSAYSPATSCGFAEGVMLGKIAVHGFVAGSARPMLAAMRHALPWWNLADDGERDLPGLDVLQAFAAGNQFAVGGKMEETRTMLHAAMPAFRRASSKLESLSRCYRRLW